MKILSIRRGFQADHSSTSYEFLALEKPLSRSEREKVARLSSRARPSRRRVSFVYHGEWSDLPGGWEPLMEKYYDVMYSESYDWWTLAMAFDADQKTIKKIERYEFRGTDDLGIFINSKGKRVIVTIYCRLSFEFYANNNSDYDYYEDDEEEDEFEEAIESEDSLLNLLAQNREYLKNGDYRLLYGVWQEYGFESEEEEEFESKIPLEPPKMDKLPQSIKYLLSALEGI